MSWENDLHEHLMLKYKDHPIRHPDPFNEKEDIVCIWTKTAAAVVQTVEKVAVAYVNGKLNKQEFIEYLNKFEVPLLIQCEIIEHAEESIKPR